MLSSTVRTTADIDEFRATIRPSNSEFLVTGRGSFLNRVVRIELHQLGMQGFEESLSRVWCMEAAVPRLGLCFATRAGGAMTWNGAEVGRDEIALVDYSRINWHRLSGPAGWASLSLPAEDIARLVPALVEQDRGTIGWCGVVVPPRVALTRLRGGLAAAVRTACTAPQLIADADAARGLEQMLLERMFDCLAGTPMRADSASCRRHGQIIARLRALAEAYAEQPLNLTEVSAAIGVNMRTLHQCCQEYLGVSPKRYLTLRRMDLARRALLAAPDATVAQVATHYGFWELGRFAGAYRSRYGESPSETLRRAPLPGRKQAAAAVPAFA
jgi:AraC-like DNA-binding protein